jgi:secondary thiamine-phosphate synthase enzyme
MIELSVRSSRREEMIDITGEVTDAVRTCGVKDGVCMVYVPHTTAAVTINENADPSVVRDILNGLAKIVPLNCGYSHAEGNADAHIKSSIVGCSVIVPIEEGRLRLGTWQGIFFCEFDGPRSRKCNIQVTSNK